MTITTAQFTQQLVENFPHSWASRAARSSGGNLNSLLASVATGLSSNLNSIAWAQSAVSVLTAIGDGLDIISLDFFGNGLPRLPGESDSAFRIRIIAGLHPQVLTRPAIEAALLLATGVTPRLIAPWNNGDTSSWDSFNYFDVDGRNIPTLWGDGLHATGLIEVTLPSISSTLPSAVYGNITEIKAEGILMGAKIRQRPLLPYLTTATVTDNVVTLVQTLNTVSNGSPLVTLTPTTTPTAGNLAYIVFTMTTELYISRLNFNELPLGWKFDAIESINNSDNGHRLWIASFYHTIQPGETSYTFNVAAASQYESPYDIHPNTDILNVIGVYYEFSNVDPSVFDIKTSISYATKGSTSLTFRQGATLSGGDAIGGMLALLSDTSTDVAVTSVSTLPGGAFTQSVNDSDYIGSSNFYFSYEQANASVALPLAITLSAGASAIGMIFSLVPTKTTMLYKSPIGTVGIEYKIPFSATAYASLCYPEWNTNFWTYVYSPIDAQASFGSASSLVGQQASLSFLQVGASTDSGYGNVVFINSSVSSIRLVAPVGTQVPSFYATPGWNTFFWISASDAYSVTLSFSMPSPGQYLSYAFFPVGTTTGTVAVASGTYSATVTVTDTLPYNVAIVPTWNTAFWIIPSNNAFTVFFSASAPADAILNWSTY